MSVQFSLISVCLSFHLDMIYVTRTLPQKSWTNPAEQIMSILNIGFRSVGLIYGKTGHYHKQLESAIFMNEIRVLAEKIQHL